LRHDDEIRMTQQSVYIGSAKKAVFVSLL
jgi:hypothetical protein